MSTHHSQRALATARVLVIGLGGLGAPAAAALAGAGVGTLGLVDPDRVDVSNLHRQPLYEEGDVGRHKVDAAAERLGRRWPGVTLETRRSRFDAGDGAALREYDVVVDGTDTLDAKFMLNDLAVAAGVPLVHAGASGLRAQLLTVVPGATACYRCLFEEPPPPGEVPSCEAAGILGPVVVLAGALQAAEAIRLLTGVPPLFADRLLTIHAGTGTWRSVPLSRNPACAACGPATIEPAARRSAVR